MTGGEDGGRYLMQGQGAGGSPGLLWTGRDGEPTDTAQSAVYMTGIVLV